MTGYFNLLLTIHLSTLSESKKAMLRLLFRYEDKISERLKVKQAELIQEAKESAARHIESVMKSPSPFVKTIEPDSAWGGSVMPIPLMYDNQKIRIIGLETGEEA